MNERSASDPPDAPERIGPYRILRTLGEGGMGIVYEAEQTEPVQRRVALKIIKLGMDTRQVVARFEAERQALAVMDHPNIASVLDGGSTETGRPYFVMELVKGTPINEYCDTHKLGVEERLALFRPVCAAVQHAHQKGVIHRDLKPSNVLITVRDDGAVPKVIDFGIAKAIGQDLTDKTLVTQFGQMVGTPEYMSPEQAEMSGVDVDTRTDIYSLGAMLYELLVGALPHDLGRVADTALQTTLREKDAPRPSARFTTLSGDRQETVAKYRRTDPSALRKTLRGDLDWVVMKCLEKDRTRRYETANALALELGRVLADEPVAARPPSPGYRMGKFVRRHRTGVAAAAVAILAIVGGASAAVVGMVRSQRAEEATALEAETAQRVSEFLVGLFELSDPGQARGADITVREVLDDGAERIGEELSGQRIVQGRLMTTIGDSYRGLGLYEQGRPLLERALELFEAEEGEAAELDAARVKNKLAYLLVHAADYDRAERLATEAMDTFGERLGEGSAPAIEALNHLAFSRLRVGRDPESLADLLEGKLTVARAALGEGDEWVATTTDHLCWAHIQRNDLVAADSTCHQALELRREFYGGDHPTIGYTLTRVASVERSLGRPEAAIDAYEEALELAGRLYGEVHPEIAYPLLGLAATYRSLGDVEAALPYAEAGVQMRRDALGPDNPELANALNELALVRLDGGDLGGAAVALEEALQIDRRAFGDRHAAVATRIGNLASVENERGRYDRAIELALEDVAMRRELDGETSETLLVPLNNLAFYRQLAGDLAGAEQAYAEAVGIAESQRPEDDVTRLVLTGNYARVLIELGRLEEACARARSAREGLEGVLSEGHWRTAVAQTVEGRCLTRAGDLETAGALLAGGWRALEETRIAGDRYRIDALEYLIEHHERAGRRDDAQRYRNLLARERP